MYLFSVARRTSEIYFPFLFTIKLLSVPVLLLTCLFFTFHCHCNKYLGNGQCSAFYLDVFLFVVLSYFLYCCCLPLIFHLLLGKNLQTWNVLYFYAADVGKAIFIHNFAISPLLDHHFNYSWEACHSLSVILLAVLYASFHLIPWKVYGWNS